MQQGFLEWLPPRRQYSVSELTTAIGGVLGSEFANIWVSGEISGLRVASSGHAYFTLKDSGAQIRCACWKGCWRLLKFKPRDGMAILARGRIEVYDPRGEYQLIVEAVEAAGAGALQVAFEELKRVLAAEGLFDAARKRPIPTLPSHIGIVTSPGGAVIQDMLHVMERRFAGLHIRLFPAQVQGEGAARQVVEGIRYFANSGWADVLIVARGGGSVEDLWTFNEEVVARAIAACSIPVISAIGHETDFTIADFVADLRAPTPSAAAELVTSTREGFFERFTTAESKMLQAMRYHLARAGRACNAIGLDRLRILLDRRLNRSLQRIDEADGAMRRLMQIAIATRRARLETLHLRLVRQDLRLRLGLARTRFDELEGRSVRLMASRLEGQNRRLESAALQLVQLNPLAVLQRGYAVVQRDSGEVLRDAATVVSGERLRIRLAQGEVRAVVDDS